MTTSRPAESDPADQQTRIRRFFLGAGLPVFLFAATVGYEAFLAALVFAPERAGWWGAFAREFRIWCFGYDPKTGGMEWSAVGMMALEPIFVALVAAVLWRRALAGLRAPGGPWRHGRAAAAGMLSALAAALALLTFARAPAGDELPPFPGERIRTRLAVPEFRLVDQTGRACRPEDLRGRVVLVTGIYAQCSTTCPEILIETRKLLDSLPPAVRSRLAVVALSLNPEYETTELMAALAAGYGFQHPEFRYLNGDPATMHRLLEQLQFARVRNPATGLIEHANLLMLVDAQGTIAYRFNLNPRHAAWLREAVGALVTEAAQAESAAVARL